MPYIRFRCFLRRNQFYPTRVCGCDRLCIRRCGTLGVGYDLSFLVCYNKMEACLIKRNDFFFLNVLESGGISVTDSMVPRTL